MWVAAPRGGPRCLGRPCATLDRFGNVKPRNLVVRVGNDFGTDRKHAHVQAVNVVGSIRLVNGTLLTGGVLHALADKRLSLRMQGQFHTQGTCRALAGVVVWRGTDATR